MATSSRAVALSLLAALAAACTPSGRGPTTAALESPAPVTPAAPVDAAALADAKAAASGFSFLRSAGGDSYEVLYFDGGGRASLLRADQMKIVHGRWVAEAAKVGDAPDPIAAICLTLFMDGASSPRRCLDPKLLAATDTEKVRGDPLGIAKWEQVPETLPRERASLSELRERIRT